MVWRGVAGLGAKTLEGGVLVVVFALAGMTVSGVAKGRHDVHPSAAGMIAGGAGLVAYCLAVLRLHPRLDALRAASGVLLVWVAVAGLCYAGLVQ